MSNHPEPHEDYIEIIIEGEQDGDNMHRLITQDTVVIDQFAKAGKPVWLLVNVSGVTKIDPEAYSEAVQSLDHQASPFERLAIFGVKQTLLGDLLEVLVKMFGDKETMQIFKSRDEALAWLRRPKHE